MKANTPAGVFYQDQDAKSDPAYFVSREDARKLIAADRAWSINSGRDIRLKEYVERMTADGLESEFGVKFFNPNQSRKISESTQDRAIGFQHSSGSRKAIPFF